MYIRTRIPPGPGQAGQSMEFNDELKELPLHISLYQVATVGENGAYTATAEYEALPLAKMDSDTKAEEWLDMRSRPQRLWMRRAWRSAMRKTRLPEKIP